MLVRWVEKYNTVIITCLILTAISLHIADETHFWYWLGMQWRAL